MFSISHVCKCVFMYDILLYVTLGVKMSIENVFRIVKNFQFTFVRVHVNEKECVRVRC